MSKWRSRWIGKDNLQTPEPDPFLLADHCLGIRIASRVRVSGNRIRTIQEEWPDRNLRVNPPSDEEIIRYLEEKAGHRALWITQDWDAFGRHGQVLQTSGISVLWLRWPKYGNFSSVDKSQMVQLVIESVYTLILESVAPVYLRLRLEHGNDLQPLLEQLQGTMTKRPAVWQPVSIE